MSTKAGEPRKVNPKGEKRKGWIKAAEMHEANADRIDRKQAKREARLQARAERKNRRQTA